jgi:hypothetical protein
MPKPQFTRFHFPKDAYIEPVKRPYTVIGTVRSKVNFTSLDAARDENELCKNYYNKAVADLVKYAKAKQGDAVIDVRSVVFLETLQAEMYKTPECSDDGGEGQILAQGTAVKWKPEVELRSDEKQPPAQAPRLVQPSPRPSPRPR